MYIISKTIKGKEFLRNSQVSLLCNSENQAIELAQFFNNQKNNLLGMWVLSENELYKEYEIDRYSNCPLYKVRIFDNNKKILIIEKKHINIRRL